MAVDTKKAIQALTMAAQQDVVKKTKAKGKQADLDVNIPAVLAQLKAMGYDPVVELTDARMNSLELNEFQKVAIDKELMKYCHAQQKAIDINATVQGGINVTFSDDEDDL